MKVGRRLATKLLNVTKFVLGIAARRRRRRRRASTTPSTWRCWRASTAVVAEATAAFEGFDYARALERTEAFFWWFCDDYVELVKGRAYGGRGDGPAASARAALRDGARRPAAAVRADAAVRRRGGVELVARRQRPRRPWPAPSGVDR